MPKIADLYVEFKEKGLSKLQVKIKSLHVALDKVQKAAESIAKVAKKAFMGLAAGIGLAARAAINFEKNMAMVSTMLRGDGMKWMPKYRKEILELSKEFGASTANLSKGLYDILSATIAPAKAMGVLRQASKTAIAGITDVATATDILLTVMKSYKIDASNVEMVSDKLFATVKRGRITFEQLATTFGKIAATASTAGLSLEETLAMVATVTRVGVNPYQSTTAVLGLLRAFLKPTKDGIRVFKKYADAAGEVNNQLGTTALRHLGLVKIFKILKDATPEELTDVFPNIRGLKALAAGMQNLKDQAYDLNLMFRSGKMTEEAYAKMKDTLAHKLKILKQRIEVVAIVLGEKFMPMIEKVANWLMDVADRISNLSDAQKENIASWAKWIAGISAALIVLPKLIALIKGVTVAVGAMTKMIAAGTLVALGPFVAGAAMLLAIPVLAVAIINKIASNQEEARKKKEEHAKKVEEVEAANLAEEERAKNTWNKYERMYVRRENRKAEARINAQYEAQKQRAQSRLGYFPTGPDVGGAPAGEMEADQRAKLRGPVRSAIAQTMAFKYESQKVGRLTGLMYQMRDLQALTAKATTSEEAQAYGYMMRPIMEELRRTGLQYKTEWVSGEGGNAIYKSAVDWKNMAKTGAIKYDSGTWKGFGQVWKDIQASILKRDPKLEELKKIAKFTEEMSGDLKKLGGGATVQPDR